MILTPYLNLSVHVHSSVHGAITGMKEGGNTKTDTTHTHYMIMHTLRHGGDLKDKIRQSELQLM